MGRRRKEIEKETEIKFDVYLFAEIVKSGGNRMEKPFEGTPSVPNYVEHLTF